MTLMVALVGEQPLANLLPVRFLKPEEVLLVYTKRTQQVAVRLQTLLGGDAEVGLLEADPYDLMALYDKLSERVSGDHPVVYNATGGTKLMALAAYALATARRQDVVYLQTEGPHGVDRDPTLRRFSFDTGGTMLAAKPERLDKPLITLDDYLRVHFGGYEERGIDPSLEGAELERAVSSVLEDGVDEVKTGVVPASVKEQIEIDVVVRQGNQVGLVEVKTGGRGSGKKSVDQLTTMAAREYGGTYTARFLVTGGSGRDDFRAVADKLEVKVIEIRDGLTNGRLSSRDQETLRIGVLERLLNDPRAARKAARRK